MTFAHYEITFNASIWAQERSSSNKKRVRYDFLKWTLIAITRSFRENQDFQTFCLLFIPTNHKFMHLPPTYVNFELNASSL